MLNNYIIRSTQVFELVTIGYKNQLKHCETLLGKQQRRL